MDAEEKTDAFMAMARELSALSDGELEAKARAEAESKSLAFDISEDGETWTVSMISTDELRAPAVMYSAEAPTKREALDAIILTSRLP